MPLSVVRIPVRGGVYGGTRSQAWEGFNFRFANWVSGDAPETIHIRYLADSGPWRLKSHPAISAASSTEHVGGAGQ